MSSAIFKYEKGIDYSLLYDKNLNQKEEFLFRQNRDFYLLSEIYEKRPANVQNIIYIFNREFYILPVNLQKIVDCLKKAESILELANNWDDRGSEGFTKDTFTSVVHFLVNYSKQIYEEHDDYIIDIPKIFPSLNGSIDIDWETDDYGLIINIAKGGEQASFYGDDKSKQMVEGTFNPKNFQLNLLPLATSSF